MLQSSLLPTNALKALGEGLPLETSVHRFSRLDHSIDMLAAAAALKRPQEALQRHDLC